MKEANPVYIQLEYGESLEAKKEILSSELFLLNSIKTIKRYSVLRIEELKIKSKIHKAIKELGMKTKETQVAFPFLKIPKRVASFNQEEKTIRKTEVSNDLESQLREIQERLKLIERR